MKYEVFLILVLVYLVSNISIVFLRSVRLLLVTTNVVPSSPILVALMMEVLGPSETPVPTRPTGLNTPEDAILHSLPREILKS
jgi:hypothetical protein